MSRKKNNLSGGNLRKQTEKEVNELLELGKLTNDESAFQQKHSYKKFKDKYNVDMVVCLHVLVEGLIKISFFQESVFWCQKILEDIRFCDKQFRLFAFQSMTESFYNLEKYEDVIEYGKKCLEHDSIENPDLLRKLLVLYYMKFASVLLNMKQEAMKYARELLKVNVALYNADNIEKFDLLSSYHDLVDLQIQLGDSKSAKRIFEKHLKLFNFNSMNPNDVLLALNEEGYEKILPIATGQEDYFEEFSIHLLSKESYDNWVKKVQLFYLVCKICWQKHIVNFGGTCNLSWGNLSLKVHVDIVKHLKLDMEIKEIREIKEVLKTDSGISAVDYCPIVRDTISTTLLLADQNPLNRADLFSNLFKLLFASNEVQPEVGILLMTTMKNFSYYVAAAQRKNDKVNSQRVMPFIQFCLKSLDEEGANSDENVDLKLQFVMLKNSLMIINHFKTDVKKEEY